MIQLVQPAPVLPAVLLSTTIAAVAWRAGSLSMSGALAALAIGAAALRASWALGTLLIVWFAMAALLSALGKRRKAVRVREIVAKPHARDAVQVLANGAVFALAAAGVIVVGGAGSAADSLSVVLSVAAAGALAAAGADTWATEIGTLYGKAPWSLRTRSRVPPGTSGAVTAIGTLALVAGALTVALVALLVHAVPSETQLAVAVAAGGIAGASGDTLLGAWLQERRWCPRCTIETEQTVHVCGTATLSAAGITVLNNDAVNVLCTLAGALVAAAVALA